ncbi:c-type cytochrome biogenesis protein CcsB [Pseudonocardia sp. ICBG1142]|uniref:c-type cytochrome biogenesis protein CcsB n=1 Tax=Pseudonocardia sp. ICBG1142 TaxID=2846760 RepID=UPI001CF63DD9|nr:c-type cytochrome biogenesis protein CcsB [Pseudonocardia sp. ICBG1142]
MSFELQLAAYSDLLYASTMFIYALSLLVSIAEYTVRGSQAKANTALGSKEREGEVRGDGGLLAGEAYAGRRLGLVSLYLLVLGAASHLASILSRGVAAHRWPMANMHEYISAICLVSIIAWLTVSYRRSRVRIGGVFIIPIVLTLMFLGGTLLYLPIGPVTPSLKSYWIAFHVSTAVLASGLFLIPGVTSCLYLIRRGGRPQRLAGLLPDESMLDRISYRATIAAFPIYTVGLILGAIWAEAAWGRYWGWDPKETVAFVAWVLYAAYLHARVSAGWGPSRAAFINIAGFAVTVFNLFFINLVVTGLHSYAGF